MRKSTTAEEIELLFPRAPSTSRLLLLVILFLLRINDSAAQHAHEHGSGQINIAIGERGATVQFFALGTPVTQALELDFDLLGPHRTWNRPRRLNTDAHRGKAFHFATVGAHEV